MINLQLSANDTDRIKAYTHEKYVVHDIQYYIKRCSAEYIFEKYKNKVLFSIS